MDEVRAQEEINKYKKFRKVDGATYRKVNQFLRKRTYITAREWALARLCTDFRTTNGAEMTFIGAHLPELVPFMEDTYSPQAVNQARNSFKKKVRKSSATFFYGAMCGFFTTEELDDLLFEASEVARFLLEVESTTLDIDEEIDIEDRITGVMRSVGEAAKTVLKTRGIETGTTDTETTAGMQPATSGPPVPPEARPGAVRRGRKRKIRGQDPTGEPTVPVVPVPERATGPQETPAPDPAVQATSSPEKIPPAAGGPASYREVSGLIPADPGHAPEDPLPGPAPELLPAAPPAVEGKDQSGADPVRPADQGSTSP